MLTHRAGPALPSYLALHHAGFSVPPVSPPERWALTPPFHPCQTLRAFRRRLTGFPVRCHRAPLRRRSILCGTFRSAASSTGLACTSHCAPWRYQARCPVKSSAPHKVKCVPQDGVRTFLPPSHLAMTKPAITRPARQFQLYSEITWNGWPVATTDQLSCRRFGFHNSRNRSRLIFLFHGPVSEQRISQNGPQGGADGRLSRKGWSKL